MSLKLATSKNTGAEFLGMLFDFPPTPNPHISMHILHTIHCILPSVLKGEFVRQRVVF